MPEPAQDVQIEIQRTPAVPPAQRFTPVTDGVRFSLPNPHRTGAVLWTIAAFLVAAHLAGQTVRYVLLGGEANGILNRFDMDLEYNFPSWYSAGLMLMAAGVLLGISQDAFARRDGRGRYWLVLAAIFAYLSADEATQIHEKLIPPLRRLLGAEGVLFYPWILPGAAFAALVAVYFRRMLASLPSATAKWIVLSGAVYVAGAIGGEALGGWYASHHGDHNLTYSFLVAFEEGLEVAGLTLFLRCLLNYATGAVAIANLDKDARNAEAAVAPPRSPELGSSISPAPDYRLPGRRRRVA